MNTPYRQRGCRQSRSGFTLFEILIILGITAVALVFATAGTSGQSSYYFLRGDVDKLQSGLQRAAVQSASRGELSFTAAVRAGMTFYLGRPMGTDWEIGGSHSFLNFFEGDPINAIPRNRVAPISAVSVDTRSRLKSLHRETILTREYIPGQAVTRLTDAAYVMFRDGKLDVFNADGTVVTSGGHRDELAAFFRLQDSPLAAGVPVAYSFDVVNVNAGWVRVRMYTGGFVEVSGINALTVAAPTNSSGGAF